MGTSGNGGYPRILADVVDVVDVVVDADADVPNAADVVDVVP